MQRKWSRAQPNCISPMFLTSKFKTIPNAHSAIKQSISMTRLTIHTFQVAVHRPPRRLPSDPSNVHGRCRRPDRGSPSSVLAAPQISEKLNETRETQSPFAPTEEILELALPSLPCVGSGSCGWYECTISDKASAGKSRRLGERHVFASTNGGHPRRIKRGSYACIS